MGRYDHERETDVMDNEILKLIQSADTPIEQRGILMMMLKISRAVTDNTNITRDIGSDLETHKAEFQKHREEYQASRIAEQKLIARGIGAWWAASLLFTVCLLVAGYIVQIHLTKLTEVVKESAESRERILRIETKMDLLQQREVPPR